MSVALDTKPNVRAEYAERISACWHRSREQIFALGNALIEARQALGETDFGAMIAKDLPFGADQARRFIRIAADPRLSARDAHHVLPETLCAMDALQSLNDEQFERAIASGAVTPALTEKDARALVREIKGHIAPAPYAVPPQHRPEAAKCGPPVPPGPDGARTWPELVHMLAARRRELGIAQLALDTAAGWTDGQTSKYEIPHADDGRIPTMGALFEWLGALGLAVKVSAT